jgi:deoxyribonuclease V
MADPALPAPLPPDRFPTTVEAAAAEQQRLRGLVRFEPPPDFAPRLVAGLDVSMERDGDVAFAGVVVLALPTLETVAEPRPWRACRCRTCPGFLSFRELPSLALAWARLLAGGVRPTRSCSTGRGGRTRALRRGVPRRRAVRHTERGVREVDPRRHARPLGPSAAPRAARAPARDGGVRAAACAPRAAGVRVARPPHGPRRGGRARRGVSAGFREPETTRRAHRLVNAVRRGERAPDVG